MRAFWPGHIEKVSVEARGWDFDPSFPNGLQFESLWHQSLCLGFAKFGSAVTVYWPRVGHPWRVEVCSGGCLFCVSRLHGDRTRLETNLFPGGVLRTMQTQQRFPNHCMTRGRCLISACSLSWWLQDLGKGLRTYLVHGGQKSETDSTSRPASARPNRQVLLRYS